MHVLHYMAVNAMHSEEAFDKVSDLLEESKGGWYDWYVIGGGRFLPGDAYSSNRSNTISYIDNKQKYMEVIKDIKKSRIDSMNNYLKEYEEYKDSLSSDMVEYISNGGQLPDDYKYSLPRFYVSKAIKLLDGEWNSDSMFFDATDFTSNMNWTEERLTDHNKAQLEFLVPVDFHF